MSVCFVEKVKKTKAGYSYVLTMCWTNRGYFEIYKTTCDKNGKNLYDFAGDRYTVGR